MFKSKKIKNMNNLKEKIILAVRSIDDLGLKTYVSANLSSKLDKLAEDFENTFLSDKNGRPTFMLKPAYDTSITEMLKEGGMLPSIGHVETAYNNENVFQKRPHLMRKEIILGKLSEEEVALKNDEVEDYWAKFNLKPIDYYPEAYLDALMRYWAKFGLPFEFQQKIFQIIAWSKNPDLRDRTDQPFNLGVSSIKSGIRKYCPIFGNYGYSGDDNIWFILEKLNPNLPVIF
jgi:hypothetical protein